MFIHLYSCINFSYIAVSNQVEDSTTSLIKKQILYAINDSPDKKLTYYQIAKKLDIKPGISSYLLSLILEKKVKPIQEGDMYVYMLDNTEKNRE